ncbi:Type IV fimbrial biogenesis protein PilY1 [Minicystis rosea]|nr:Type IV fimbrial biogenesis protein PilY1 [Minicystis rosea]
MMGIGLAGLVACAAGTEETVVTGGGGGGGSGGTTSASSSTSTGRPILCGNGFKEPGEECDNEDFGDLTCQSFGFASGSLVCNGYCSVIAAKCHLLENCFNGGDDNGNGLLDCEDPECDGNSACADTCTPSTPAAIHVFITSSTAGRPAVHAASCSAASGKEMIYRIIADQDGKLVVKLSSNVADFSISVRTACGDDASEIACANKPADGNGVDLERLVVPVTAGTTYFVMVDGNTPEDMGFFQLVVDRPESNCKNLSDDDGNGYVDCDDADLCQTRPECVPGPTPVGEPCALATECQANHNDPICFGPIQGFVGGYCSEFCDPVADDCGPSSVCVTGLLDSVHGVCLTACIDASDCRAGYACVDLGLAQKVCTIEPEPDCTNQTDDDFDGKIDCADPDCQSKPACAPGANKAGAPCTANTDCAADHHDPICLSLPDGYCSEVCNTFPDDCPAGSVCVPAGPAGETVCMATCTSQAECRAGYTCQSVGIAEDICW